jgi:hypothetical protein
MPAMSRPRRAAFIALLGMAWAALLPFTAAARMLVSDAPVEHCHRLNIDSVADPDPVAADGPSQPRKAKCPYCASAVVAPPASPPPMPGFVRLAVGIDAPQVFLPSLQRTAVVVPPSRAPPASSSAAH